MTTVIFDYGHLRACLHSPGIEPDPSGIVVAISISCCLILISSMSTKKEQGYRYLPASWRFSEERPAGQSMELSLFKQVL